MQKIKLLFLIIFVTYICSSCANVNYQMEINKDGSGNFTYLIEIDKVQYESYKTKYETTVQALKTALEQSGFSVREYVNEDKNIFEAKLYLEDVEKIDEFATLLIPVVEGEPTVIYEKNILGESYEFNGKIDLTSYSDTEMELERDEVIKDNLPIEFNLKIPFKVKESNATKVESQVLTWNLEYNQENIIRVKFGTINYKLIIALCIILFAIVQFATIKIVEKIMNLKK